MSLRGSSRLHCSYPSIRIQLHSQSVEITKKKFAAGTLARSLGASGAVACDAYAASSARECVLCAGARGARTLMVQGACSGSILAGRWCVSEDA
jgi:hypothetical protein